jgi:D-3-phosphoglycerate dehydrogenase / 2-oxoglutarate reductase
MPKQDHIIFIIDFDSTFVQVETLDELASVALSGNPDQGKIVEKISRITDLGMEGKIPFDESLERRIALLTASKKHIEKLVRRLGKKISHSIRRNKPFFQKHGKRIIILSGGFREIVAPIVKPFGIPEKNVYANRFTYDRYGNITGFEKKNKLAKEGGKIELIRSLGLKGDVFVLGDGHTDYQLKVAGLAHKFFAFTENVSREGVIQKADHVTPSFDEFLFAINHPMKTFYPRNRIRVLLLENIHQSTVDMMTREGFTVEQMKGSLVEKELAEKIRDVHLLGIRSKTKVTKKVLENANRLLAIGTFCIGTDQVDLKEATKKGVAVFNAPYSNTRSVVEMALAEIIALKRKIFERSSELHRGIWKKSASNCHEIRGKTLGIIGYGNIGSQLSVAAESLGMEVYYFDIAEKMALGNAKKCTSMTELLKKSDVVTIHVDGRPENNNLIGEKEFRLMKPGVIFLNLARGKVVDIKSLVNNLKNGKIRGAAVDVFPKEPKNNEEKFESELRKFPNVILTPHIGGSTEEAQKNIAKFVAEKLSGYINSGNTSGSVNFPNIVIPPVKNFHRLLHIHENVPGILARINGILAREKINIERQDLKTNEDIGYAIMDIGKKHDKEVTKKMRKIPNTIKFRILY